MWDGENHPITTLPIANIQLPRLDKVNANIGSPADLTQMSASSGAGAGSGGAITLVPVPVLPAEC